MDWFSENPKMLQEEWQAIVDHSADHTRYLWRSASEKATFVTDTPIKLDEEQTTGNWLFVFELTKSAVGKALSFEPELSDKLHKLDRVHTYTSFHVADLKRH
jgi:S-adenosylmethionine-diacylglycerol 3-amino-3-carboxypropyl transferase